MNSNAVKKLCVVGAGQMGEQIALAAALNGFEVIVNDLSKEALAKTDKWVEDYLESRVGKGKLSDEARTEARKRFKTNCDLQQAVQDVDLVIEAIVEDLNIKRELFAKLDDLCPKHTILATNSSSFVPSQLAEVTVRKDKVIGMHFFNPALVMELVEVIQGPDTSEETAVSVMEVSKKMNKTPILLQKEINGFVVNRILGRTYEEACRLLEAGIATPEDIDTAVTKALRWPMGPFVMMDMVGIDTCYKIRVQRFKESKNEIDRPPDIMKKMYEAGTLGRKTGKGFFEYK